MVIVGISRSEDASLFYSFFYDRFGMCCDIWPRSLTGDPTYLLFWYVLQYVLLTTWRVF